MRDNEILLCFSASYAEAREKFLSACEERSLVVENRLNPNARGTNGEELFTDIVRIGSRNAPKVLLLISGTHGVEGYCGSGVQVGLLRQGFFDNLPADTSVMMVHAVNPYGFEHDRRVNEDNIDLNRNFLDFEGPRPKNDYPKIHKFVLPFHWDNAGLEAANAGLGNYIKRHGMPVFQATISGGQYQFPDGLFYGGIEPSWSNTMFRSILRDQLSDVDCLGVVDFHTGLGPYGHGELITIGSESQKALAARWYGNQVTDPEAGTSISARLDGMLANGIRETLPNAQISFVTIEFGTRDISTVLNALRGDNWLYQRGDLTSPIGKGIKKDIRSAFYPEEDDWKYSVWSRSCDVIKLAMHGIADI